MASLESTNPEEIIGWAQKRGAKILVPLPGTGGGNVEADKRSFIRMISLQINPLRSVKMETTYYFEPIRKTIYC